MISSLTVFWRQTREIFHRADYDVWGESEVAATLNDIMIAGIFLVYENQRLVLQILNAEHISGIIRMSLMDNGVHFSSIDSGGGQFRMGTGSDHKSDIQCTVKKTFGYFLILQFVPLQLQFRKIVC